MNITLNTKYEKLNTCRKPNFTAQLRGSAVRSAIKSAKDTFQLSEISEIIDNINKPEIVKFTELMRELGIDVEDYMDTKELLKAIYRIKESK